MDTEVISSLTKDWMHVFGLPLGGKKVLQHACLPLCALPAWAITAEEETHHTLRIHSHSQHI